MHDAAPSDPSGPSEPSGTAPDPQRRAQRRKRIRLAAIATTLLLAAAAGTGWLLYERIDGGIRTDDATTRALEEVAADRPQHGPGRAQNILLLGSDAEAGVGSERADTTMLLHTSPHSGRSALMSVPRDLLVDIPSCRTPGGGRSEAQRAQFNWAFQFGGTACTIRTFEKLTGIRVDHHAVVEFSGFKRMVDAVGGVEMDIDQPVHDPESGITLKPGHQRLDGAQALVYVRTRLGVGDGSDTQRMGRQQRFMRALMDRSLNVRTLSNPTHAYPLLRAAASSLTCDPGLDSLRELYGLARRSSGVSASATRFLTLPRQAAEGDTDRDELVQPEARQLFAKLRSDRPVA
ncbi:LCP family protein [Streptomyces sp. NPDC050738]|uniref:LCP family protein n=1 Tax=Streptomyces sp. NPDC050738 TaxID=3154744 RepID=UPI00341FB28F